MIAVEGLRFAHPGATFALHLPELRVAPGERVACVGPSGSGKTTLVHLLAGILLPDAGTLRVDGVALRDLSEAGRRAFRLRRVGLLFQDLALLDSLSALDNVLLPFHLQGRAAVTPARRAAARDLAASVGLDAALLARRPSRLSQGERQRVALCRALVTEPALLLCDEPTGSLDPGSAAAVLDHVLQWACARGATVLMVTHDHGLLPRFDRVLDMTELRAAS